MNKIFKKIWNQSRGCFVAVSEAITAARQNTGKATVLIGSIGLLLSGSSQAAVVINGNVHDADSRSVSYTHLDVYKRQSRNSIRAPSQ